MSSTLAVLRERGRPLRAYLAQPDSPHPHPRVVVIHEAYGLNDNIRTGAHHSFFDDHGRAYDPDAAADAWQRTLSFFDQLRS